MEGKRLKEAKKAIERIKLYPIEEAVKLVKERAKAKFDETIEIAMNLGVDPRHADQMVRGVCALPNGTGRTVRVAVFARGAKADEAKAAGADVIGAEELVTQVQGGNINFDKCIATPDMMPLVGRLGKILGPRGMMPNPKVGTVTMDVTEAMRGAKGGSVEFRVEKAGILHAGIGKASFTEAALIENVKAFAEAVIKAKPAGAKGTFVKRVALSSTMGPGVKIEPGTLSSGARNSSSAGLVERLSDFAPGLPAGSRCSKVSDGSPSDWPGAESSWPLSPGNRGQPVQDCWCRRDLPNGLIPPA